MPIPLSNHDGGSQVLDNVLQIIDHDKEKFLEEAIKGFSLIEKLRKTRKNWQSCILTPVITILANSGYSVYTNILGVRLPKLQTNVAENVKNIVSWCKSPPCSPRYRDRCLNKDTTSEIDAVVTKDDNICAIEHASYISALCWDMVKLYKLASSRNDISACLFLTWLDTSDEEDERYAESLVRLGNMLFNSSIGKDKWAIGYVLYYPEPKTTTYYISSLEFYHQLEKRQPT